LHGTDVYEHIETIYDKDSPGNEISKNQLVRHSEEYVPRIEYNRWKTGEMYGFKDKQLTKQVYTVSLHGLNSLVIIRASKVIFSDHR
jgi:hypothetical protein